MAIRVHRSLLPLVVLLILSGALSAAALRFDLLSGHTKCISDDIKVGAMAVGKYQVVEPEGSSQLPDSHRISLRVTSPYGNSLHYSEHVQSGNFAFTSSEAGDYLACFWAPDHRPPSTITFEFDWRSGVSAKDWSAVAKKGQVDTSGSRKVLVLYDDNTKRKCGPSASSSRQIMELELKKLEDTIKSIHEEMFYLREREGEMQILNGRTNSRMAWLSFLSLGICLSVAGLQLWHLKNFFERKKLL